MKVFFTATPTKLEIYKPVYQQMGEVIERLGHKFSCRWILDFDESFFELPEKKWIKHYNSIVSSLDKADVALFDISVSSTTVGQLIQHALISRKPVICLKDRSVEKNIFLSGAGQKESKLVLVEYKRENLDQTLGDALEYIEDWLESRFTLILDGRTRQMLDRVAKKGKSRSEYIRELIHEASEAK